MGFYRDLTDFLVLLIGLFLCFFLQIWNLFCQFGITFHSFFSIFSAVDPYAIPLDEEGDTDLESYKDAPSKKPPPKKPEKKKTFPQYEPDVYVYKTKKRDKIILIVLVLLAVVLMAGVTTFILTMTD